MAVKANLGSGLTKIVIRVVTLITSAIKIIGELIMLIQYKVSKLEVSKLKVSKLEVFRVTIVVKRVESKTK